MIFERALKYPEIENSESSLYSSILIGGFFLLMIESGIDARALAANLISSEPGRYFSGVCGIDSLLALIEAA